MTETRIDQITSPTGKVGPTCALTHYGSFRMTEVVRVVGHLGEGLNGTFET